MHIFGTAVLMLGLASVVLAQLYATIMVFTANPFKGVLCFVIPGYVLLVAKREGFYRKFLVAFVAGILGMVVGGSILS